MFSPSCSSCQVVCSFICLRISCSCNHFNLSGQWVVIFKLLLNKVTTESFLKKSNQSKQLAKSYCHLLAKNTKLKPIVRGLKEKKKIRRNWLYQGLKDPPAPRHWCSGDCQVMKALMGGCWVQTWTGGLCTPPQGPSPTYSWRGCKRSQRSYSQLWSLSRVAPLCFLM